MELSGHSQASTLLNSYVHATSGSIKNALDIQDRLRPDAKMLETLELETDLANWMANVKSEKF
jgi:hypothetical protein